MKWIAISGSWRQSNSRLEQDVRKTVRQILNRGDGIVSGGALGVDYFATDEALKIDPEAQRIKVFIPASLKIYSDHYFNRAKEGVITSRKAHQLIKQLKNLKAINPNALITAKSKTINQDTYFERNSNIINQADKLITFWVNESEGVKDTIQKARRKGIAVKIYKYTI